MPEAGEAISSSISMRACQNYEQKLALRIIAGVGSIRERVRLCQWIQSFFSNANVINFGYIM